MSCLRWPVKNKIGNCLFINLYQTVTYKKKLYQTISIGIHIKHSFEYIKLIQNVINTTSCVFNC
jgi:hypothetical protein